MSKHERELYFQIRAVGLPKPEREYQFESSRKWRADFAWPDHKLIVEVDGGGWVHGRHHRGKGYMQDRERDNTAVLLGWRVLRFVPEHIRSGEAIRMIEVALLDLPEAA